MPKHLVRLQNTYVQDGLGILAVYGVSDEEEDTEEATRKFVEDENYQFPVLFDNENKTVKRFGVLGFPKAFLVDREQRIVWHGDPRRPEVDEAIVKHLFGDEQEPTHSASGYSGRGDFVLLPPGQDALTGGLTGELKGISRYDLPFHAAIPRQGAMVADIGCGSGAFSFKLADAVGREGKVLCRDISQKAIETIKRKAEEGDYINVDGALSEKDNVNLPTESIDLALLSDVYHFVVRQDATENFVDSLYTAMKPGGVVVVTHVRMGMLQVEKDWRVHFERIIADFTNRGFEAGHRWILSDSQDDRPMLILEFRRPIE